MIFSPDRFLTTSLRDSSMGENICEILSAAMNQADAEAAIKNTVLRDANWIIISNERINFNNYKRIFILGAGKAVVPMAYAISNILGTALTRGAIITKDGYLDRTLYPIPNRIEVLEAGHPIPDQRNLQASSSILALAQNLQGDDLIICLISGGGSSLLIKPSSGLSLQDIQAVTTLLLSCGASIDEINTIRKHLDGFKGGGLARLLYPATVISLILSDVIGDHLDMVASGPTVADSTTFGAAWVLLEKYQIVDQVPHAVQAHLKDGRSGRLPETLKPGDPMLDKVHNLLVGNNTQVVKAASQAAQNLGFITKIETTTLQGEASNVGQMLAETALLMLKQRNNIGQPSCLITGGETTVTIKGSGKGGRNQELALGSVVSLSATEHPLILVSLATDGGDGPTDAAGAVATNQTFSRGEALGLHPEEFLQRNDAYHYFARLGDLIKTGPTLTNVNDLVMIFIA